IDPAIGTKLGITMTTQEEIFRTADIITLHVPLTPQTEKLIRPETLALMKPSAIVINTSRGPVVDEPALAHALAAGTIAGAGLDVFEEEPLPADHPFCSLANVILTAHVAGVDLRSRDDMARVGAECIVELLAGRWPEEWIVNPEVRPAFEKRRAELLGK
ncbi:MAG: NAD(P)-dependent oxidoreductase, partial [Gemmataceae bacterium]